MISVVIIDDEYLIRSLIRKLISWEDLGLEVVGEAQNGEEALDLIRRESPQIAIVDINMPIMNGLELAQKLQELRQEIQIIFLTGYQNFEYAKQAVTYHAFEYLLKPISAEELTQTLKRLADQIRGQNAQRLLRTEPAAGHRASHTLQESFLRKLIFGKLNIPASRIEPELRQLGLPLKSERLVSIVAKIDAQDAAHDSLYAYAVMNILSELLHEHRNFENICEFPSEDNHVIILCNVKSPADVERSAAQMCSRLNQVIRSNFSFVVTVGVSEVFQGLSSVPEQVMLAMNALGSRFYSQDTALFFAAQERAPTASAEALSSLSYEALETSVEAQEWEAGRICIQTLFQQMQEQKIQENLFRAIALGIAAILYFMVDKYQLDKTRFMETWTEASLPLQVAQSAGSQEIEALILQFYDMLVSAMQDLRSLSRLTSTVRDYIRKNFCSREISLKKIAADVYASPAYISSLFKTEMGVTITEYITVLRIQRAAEILKRDLDASLPDVAEQVGYGDPYYFSKCFKKYFGVTPSKYTVDSSWRKKNREGAFRPERSGEGNPSREE